LDSLKRFTPKQKGISSAGRPKKSDGKSERTSLPA
jgi:hypothetical protein